jgi:1-deoxy-D-xylulose-5-phosphate synthase
VALFALGNMQHLARQAAEKLTADGCDVALINPRFFKPLDAGTHEFFGRSADVVATLEDHVLMGGYGSAVLEFFSERGIATPLVRLGWPDQFIEHATTVERLREQYGLTAAALVNRVQAALPGAAKEEVREIEPARKLIGAA